MASNSNISELQQNAKERLRIISGHLQKPANREQLRVSANECKAEAADRSLEKNRTIPKRSTVCEQRVASLEP
ncbi:UNVERIFIED_CONTAM: hypothetical protein FKN15_076891 [Acipenser sinensis]